MSAAWRRTVLLPAMLGPVMTRSCPAVPSGARAGAAGARRAARGPPPAARPCGRDEETWRSLGTKPPESGGSMASTTGWRPSSITSSSERSTSGRA